MIRPRWRAIGVASPATSTMVGRHHRKPLFQSLTGSFGRFRSFLGVSDSQKRLELRPAAPVVNRASDMKTLVDAAADALKMAESIRARRGDGASSEMIVDEITRILDSEGLGDRQVSSARQLVDLVKLAAHLRMR